MAKLVLLFCTSLIVVAATLSGCMQKISLSPKSDTPAPTHQNLSGRRVLLTEPPPGAQSKPPPPPKQAPPPEAPKVPVKLSGTWKIGFLFGTKNYTSTINLTQDGNSFHGTGTDDDSNLAFAIEQGTINGQQVSFIKTYSDGKHQAIEYDGTFQVVNDPNYSGPYMSGEYQLASHGKPVSSIWEAEVVTDQKPQANSQTPPQNPPPSPPPEAPPPPKHPQLSGKWNVGYEYNFKTIHSIMYLEQDGGKLTGHGFDQNTKEKFVITKGWYNYPRVTVVRKYLKGKGGAASEREMTFKATVTWVSAPDYQGPYLNGKTQGGGAWEAELLK
jgi:hypothetical protein